jgi:DNA anti-recombination protein RmuC
MVEENEEIKYRDKAIDETVNIIIEELCGPIEDSLEKWKNELQIRFDEYCKKMQESQNISKKDFENTLIERKQLLNNFLKDINRLKTSMSDQNKDINEIILKMDKNFQKRIKITYENLNFVKKEIGSQIEKNQINLKKDLSSFLSSHEEKLDKVNEYMIEKIESFEKHTKKQTDKADKHYNILNRDLRKTKILFYISLSLIIILCISNLIWVLK